MKNKNLFFIIILPIFVGFAVWQISQSRTDAQPAKQALMSENTQPPDKIIKVDITPNSTYGQLMDQAGTSVTLANNILESAAAVYDLSKIRVGRVLNLHFNPVTDKFKQLVYQIDSEEELYVSLIDCPIVVDAPTSTLAAVNNQCWQAERKKINYQLQTKIVGGTLTDSLYQWALANNVDERVIINLADAYQWTIDFAMDPRVGDTFKFIYQERYLDGRYVMPGQILAAKYVNAGTDHRLYYFEEDANNQGFFDPNGNSVRKELLKAPIQYKYITSGFTTGLRCLESYGLCTGHRAIDYAAPIGTPIRAVGDGTVTYAGWSSAGYGNLTSIRHNGTYSTNYAHQSKIIVKRGQQVKQDEIIGYVGSTGLSTGPHLHYELVKYGTKINPLTEDLPPGEPVKPGNKERFLQSIAPYQDQLNGG